MSSQEIQKKHVTIEEANKSIPEVERIIAKMVATNRSLNALTSVDIEFEEEFKELSYDVQFNRKFHELNCEYYKCFEDLLKMGAVLKNLDHRVVDFFSKKGEQDIFLCWQLGEKEIQWWHAIEEDIKSRQPIATLHHQTKQGTSEQETENKGEAK